MYGNCLSNVYGRKGEPISNTKRANHLGALALTSYSLGVTVSTSHIDALAYRA